MGKLQYDLTGQQFGRWLVLGRADNGNCHQVMWLSECQCGSGIRKAIHSQTLRDGNATSCGCLREARNLAARKRPFEYLYNRLITQAASRNVYLDVTYEQFITFTATDFCFYCHHHITWHAHSSVVDGYFSHAYNLDRMDNDKGYVLGNIVVCCPRCNRSKRGEWSFDEWYAMTAIFRHSQGTL